jgi:hypothetical protein
MSAWCHVHQYGTAFLVRIHCVIHTNLTNYDWSVHISGTYSLCLRIDVDDSVKRSHWPVFRNL